MRELDIGPSCCSEYCSAHPYIKLMLAYLHSPLRAWNGIEQVPFLTQSERQRNPIKCTSIVFINIQSRIKEARIKLFCSSRELIRIIVWRSLESWVDSNHILRNHHEFWVESNQFLGKWFNPILNRSNYFDEAELKISPNSSK